MEIKIDYSYSLNENSNIQATICKPTNEDSEYSDPDSSSSDEYNCGGDVDGVNEEDADEEDATDEDYTATNDVGRIIAA